MAVDDEEALYLEAIESLERIASREELPGDRMVVRNVLEAHKKSMSKTIVESMYKQVMALSSQLQRSYERIAFLEKELLEASDRTPAKPG